MGRVLFSDAVDSVGWPEGEVRMIKMWVVINAIAVALAGLRGIQSHRRERAFWRAYAEGRIAQDVVGGGQGL